jgi:prolyl-tRNA synthetase
MKLSHYLLPTVKETPADAVVVSHKLMLRAGMIRQVARGVYNYLPLALRSLRKVEAIVREEMDRAGAQEILMPAVQPAELWQRSGRWEQYGPELLRFKDRSQSDFCIGPTHEEVVTDLVANEVRSYRQMPLTLYQIQTKFRDEVRPRFGLMRGREFLMKDAYSFDVDEAGAFKSYEAMYEAYRRIFTRCGLKFRAVEADTGSIGGSRSHEFHVLAQSGEDEIASCTVTDYAANTELAEMRWPSAFAALKPAGSAKATALTAEARAALATARTALLAGRSEGALSKVHTPGQRTIDEVAAFLNVAKTQKLKTLVFVLDGQPVIGIVRGDRELNEIKLKKALGGDQIALADEKTVQAVTGAPVGFAGPVKLAQSVPVVVDPLVLEIVDGVCGANEADYHLVGVNVLRDYNPTHIADLTTTVAGDLSPRAENGTLEIHRGIEVGHVFYLGTKYSKPMGSYYLDDKGEKHDTVMGCYGIGVSRTMASAIEQNHDDAGIIWPMAIAPFHVVICPVNPKNDPVLTAAAEKLYADLLEAGIETLFDDRGERAGTMFKDADLIGIPLRVTVGRSFAEGSFELKRRAATESELVPVAAIVERLKAEIAKG